LQRTGARGLAGFEEALELGGVGAGPLRIVCKSQSEMVGTFGDGLAKFVGDLIAGGFGERFLGVGGGRFGGRAQVDAEQLLEFLVVGVAHAVDDDAFEESVAFVLGLGLAVFSAQLLDEIGQFLRRQVVGVEDVVRFCLGLLEAVLGDLIDDQGIALSLECRLDARECFGGCRDTAAPGGRLCPFSLRRGACRRRGRAFSR